jgi:hypothetical protein
MKAGIGILADHAAQNFTRKIVFALAQEHPIDLLASIHQAHISLKQPFTFESMKRLEAYFDSFAESVVPFRIELDKIYYTQWGEYSILGLNVKETPILRGLHDRLNQELTAVVLDPTAPHDGEDYRFHMTIEMGVPVGGDPYRAYFDRLTDKRVDLSFLAEEIALFCSTDEDNLSYFNYKVLPLAGEE